MRRSSHLNSEYLPRGAGAQLGRLIALLIVVILVYSWARDPRNWQWLGMLGVQTTDEAANSAPIVPPPAAGEVPPGANDTDPKEMEEASRQFEALDDHRKLAPAEMPAYWRLMRWARSEKFADLEKRAPPSPKFRDIYDDPAEYRGQLMRLKVHVRRVTSHEAPENSAGVKTVYEAWGWTDDSKSYPWVLVFSELPPEMQVGETVFEDGVFVGYFLKMLWYTNAEGKPQTAPLLVGQMAYVATPKVAAAPEISVKSVVTFGVGAVILFALIGLFSYRMTTRRRKRLVEHTDAGDEEVQDWLKQQSPQTSSNRPRNDDQ